MSAPAAALGLFIKCPPEAKESNVKSNVVVSMVMSFGPLLLTSSFFGFEKGTTTITIAERCDDSCCRPPIKIKARSEEVQMT